MKTETVLRIAEEVEMGLIENDIDINELESLYERAGGDESYQKWCTLHEDELMENWVAEHEDITEIDDKLAADAIVYTLKHYMDWLKRQQLN